MYEYEERLSGEPHPQEGPKETLSGMEATRLEQEKETSKKRGEGLVSAFR